MLKIDIDKLEMLQTKQCLSKAKLSARADISRQTLANIYNKNTNAAPATIGRLAKALGVEVEEITKSNKKKC